MDILGDENEEDAILPPATSSGSSNSIVGEIQFSAVQDDKGKERDLYNDEVLPAHQVPIKQLMPTVPAFMKEMRRYWNKLFCHRVPIKGYTGLEIADSEILELTKPLVVEDSWWLFSPLELMSVGPTLQVKWSILQPSCTRKFINQQLTQ